MDSDKIVYEWMDGSVYPLNELYTYIYIIFSFHYV
jgi:hypothetical protein